MSTGTTTQEPEVGGMAVEVGQRRRWTRGDAGRNDGEFVVTRVRGNECWTEWSSGNMAGKGEAFFFCGSVLNLSELLATPSTPDTVTTVGAVEVGQLWEMGGGYGRAYVRGIREFDGGVMMSRTPNGEHFCTELPSSFTNGTHTLLAPSTPVTTGGVMEADERGMPARCLKCGGPKGDRVFACNPCCGTPDTWSEMNALYDEWQAGARDFPRSPANPPRVAPPEAGPAAPQRREVSQDGRTWVDYERVTNVAAFEAWPWRRHTNEWGHWVNVQPEELRGYGGKTWAEHVTGDMNMAVGMRQRDHEACTHKLLKDRVVEASPSPHQSHAIGAGLGVWNLRSGR